MKYVLAFDQGTTSSRSIVFDRSGRLISASQLETTQIYPRPGWVEHDVNELWRTQCETAIAAMSDRGLSSSEIACLGITNQRETTVVWDRKTGEPVSNAIVWQDRRTASLCSTLRVEHGEAIREKTGLEVDAYFSASKLKWMLDNVPGSRVKAEHGELAFGTVDTWLLWKLTDGRCHATDISNASRTMLFNINSCQWDDDLLALFDIPASVLPEVRSSSEIFDEVSSPAELRGIPIGSLIGDQQAALFGQTCFSAGQTKNTYGTGCFVLQNTGSRPKRSHNRLLTTVAWGIDGEVSYALEGSVFVAGAVVQWLRDSLGIINTSGEIESLAASVPDSGGVYFVPAFAGLGTPHWDQDARALIIGMTRGTGKAHIARAALEAIAFQTVDLISAIRDDSDSPIDELRVDGGATENSLLMQLQADLLQVPVARSKMNETTALGAAYLAGLACGLWADEAELSAHEAVVQRFYPSISAHAAARSIGRWHDAVSRCLGWASSNEK